MALSVRRFDLGKGSSLDAVNRFLREEEIRRDDVLQVNINQLGKDHAEYLLLIRDSRAPFIVATLPADGETGVGPGTTLVAIFSEPIQPVVSGDVEIFNITDNVLVSAVNYTIDNAQVGQSRGVLRIADTGGYQIDGKVYRVTYKTTIKDLDGNSMEEAVDVIFTVSVALSSLDFDGGIVSALSFTNPSLNRWEVLVTPVRLTLTPSTLIELTFQGNSGDELTSFTPHVEKLGASFRIVLEHDFKDQVPEPTGILPTGIGIQWLAVKGL
jgi:hypothetical protein